MTPYKHLQRICAALPEAVEDEKWGEPHFCVNTKIFCGFGTNDEGHASIGFKMAKEDAFQIVEMDDRYSRAKYVGQHGWVNMVVEFVEDWSEVEERVRDSYRMIAPKRLGKLVD